MTPVRVLLGVLLWWSVSFSGVLVIFGAPGDTYNEFIAVFRPADETPELRGEALTKTIRQNAPDVEVLREINVGSMRTVLLRATNETALDGIREIAGFRYVEPNYISRQMPVPDDPVELYPNALPPSDTSTTEPPETTQPEWNETMCVRKYPGEEFWGLGRVHAKERPWSYEDAPFVQSEIDDGQGVDIYVVDSGIYLNHTEFGGRAFWGMSAKRCRNATDERGHGTHVASIAAGASVGVARGANVFAVHVIRDGGQLACFDLLEGLGWILDRVKRERKEGKKVKAIANLSLWSTGGGVDEGVLKLIDNGITVVVSAGNDARNACSQSPARVREAITVGSVTSADQISSFSNHGKCVDILAPGSRIKAAGTTNPSDLLKKSGTSMAAPFVTGIAARYLSTVTGCDVPTPAQVKAHILATAGRGFLCGATGSWPSRTPNLLLHHDCISRKTVVGPPPCDEANTFRGEYHVIAMVMWVVKVLV